MLADLSFNTTWNTERIGTISKETLKKIELARLRYFSHVFTEGIDH